MLSALIFAVYFALMAGLIGYACQSGRPRGLPDATAVDLPPREPGGDEDTQIAA